ncbi:MAG: RDD family protein [Nitrosopumilaceae archaeon]
MKSSVPTSNQVLDSQLGIKYTSEKIPQITLAKMSHRYLAWVIDYTIIFAIGLIVFIVGNSISNFQALIIGKFQYARYFEYGLMSVVFFLYWLILEYKTGQSIGKMALHLKITNLSGEAADFKSIVISSFGKAVLLPVDVIFGRIFTNKKRQRIFNRLGKTIVIKVPQTDDEPENISYKKD